MGWFCASPYPLSFYAKGLDGPYPDDPQCGEWKGRGVWTTSGRPGAVAEGRRQGAPFPIAFHFPAAPPTPLARLTGAKPPSPPEIT